MKYLISIALFTITFSFVYSRTINVCLNCPVSGVKEAIDLSNDGDTIIVTGGTYKEGNIVLDKSIALIGKKWPTLDGENKTEILTVLSHGVIIEGFIIQNVGTSYIEDRAGIRLKKVKNFVIRNNRLLNSFFGIYLENCSNGKVISNVVTGEAEYEMSSGNAIHCWYCKNLEVRGNVITHHRDGIYFEFVDNSIIIDNLSEDNLRYGLHFMFSNEDDYYNNTFRRNGSGVAVMFSKKINMWENDFEENWGTASYGLLLKEIYDAEIINNSFSQNTIGIFVEGSTRINYLKNNFVQNGWAIKMAGGCLDNIFSSNNFISNTFDVSISSSANNNQFDGNYWSDYSGYDLDRDGVGDIPFRPVKLFNYVVNKTPEAIVLLRSPFVDLINFSEKVSPIFTPADVKDNGPLMKKLVIK